MKQTSPDRKRDTKTNKRERERGDGSEKNRGVIKKHRQRGRHDARVTINKRLRG